MSKEVKEVIKKMIYELNQFWNAMMKTGIELYQTTHEKMVLETVQSSMYYVNKYFIETVHRIDDSILPENLYKAACIPGDHTMLIPAVMEWGRDFCEDKVKPHSEYKIQKMDEYMREHGINVDKAVDCIKEEVAKLGGKIERDDASGKWSVSGIDSVDFDRIMNKVRDKMKEDGIETKIVKVNKDEIEDGEFKPVEEGSKTAASSMASDAGKNPASASGDNAKDAESQASQEKVKVMKDAMKSANEELGINLD